MSSIEKRFSELLEKYGHLSYIRPAMLPRIDLYMDQVTTFMEERLGDMRMNPEEKILTKTMINNYAKNKLMPPPIRKKYTNDHLLLLIYIYYLKNIVSISDLSALLGPMTERYWGRSKEDKINMRSIYSEVLRQEFHVYQDSIKDIQRRMDLAAKSFTDSDLPENEQDYLRSFSLIAMLAFDITLKKRIIEAIIKEIRHSTSSEGHASGAHNAKNSPKINPSEGKHRK